jgi:hypothetical protein
VKLKSPSCANVGLAVEGILPDDSGIKPLVVNVELYEMSPPPGNRGGAVSGAAPCPIADGTQSDNTNNSNARRPQEMRSDFLNFKRTAPVEEWLAHVCVSREPTGLDTERQDIGRTEDRRSVGLVCYPAYRRCDAQRFIERLHYPDSDSSERMAGRRGLADYVTSR